MGDVEDLVPMVIEALKDNGGSAKIIEISKYIWDNYEDELRISGDLFYRWQYILRWTGTKLRNEGVLLSASDSPNGLWVLSTSY